MWLRTLTIGLLAVAAQWAAPDAPATARSSPQLIPPISVSTKTRTVRSDGTRLIVVTSVTVSNVRRSVRLAIRCRRCHRLRRTKIHRRTTATSRTYTGVHWVLPRGRGIAVDAVQAGRLGRWTVLGPGRRNPRKLVFKGSGCLRKLKRIMCPAGTVVPPADTPVPVTPALPAPPPAVPPPPVTPPAPAPAPAPPPPPPQRTVSLAKGASAAGQPGCSSSACRYLAVSFSNFSNAGHTIVCRASNGDEGGFFTYTRSGSSGSSAACYYGFGGRTVWVTVDGVSSNQIVW